MAGEKDAVATGAQADQQQDAACSGRAAMRRSREKLERQREKQGSGALPNTSSLFQTADDSQRAFPAAWKDEYKGHQAHVDQVDEGLDDSGWEPEPQNAM